MMRPASLLLAAVAALAPGPLAPDVRAESPSEGTIDAGDARVEILGKPVRVGETIELPEGFIRVEEAGTEDLQVGSFSVVPASSLRATAAARLEPPDQAPPAPDAGAAAASATPPEGRDAARAPELPCRAERSAYLSELWKLSGIDARDADALLEGLEGPGRGPRTGFYWFALATDPFRPLAWSPELRSRADALERCVREHGDDRPVSGGR